MTVQMTNDKERFKFWKLCKKLSRIQKFIYLQFGVFSEKLRQSPKIVKLL